MAADLSIVVAGQAGQGLATIANVVTRILKNSGYFTFTTTELMSRIRGGINTVQIRIASQPVSAPVNRIDLLMPLHNDAIAHTAWRTSSKTIVFGDLERVLATSDHGCVPVSLPLLELAKAAGAPGAANMAAAGAILGALGVPKTQVGPVLKRELGKKGAEAVKSSTAALLAGYEAGQGKAPSVNLPLPKPRKACKANLLMTGSEAIAMGAANGGCNFIASYPMSPGTGVLTFLYHHAKEFGIVAEQAEDEIAAINMAVAAWYAGARAMVTTSGGGFALMTEGVSLAAMTETPVVVHIGQRPGPATGLPTRTEQGDLNLALYAGHGEFPRAIFAPADAAQGFSLAHHCFNIADKFQIPVFLLSDQFILDSVYSVDPTTLPLGSQVERHVVVTQPDYRRHTLTPDGISPRGVPGLGQGLVRVDSDEHDQWGHITESYETRIEQHEKRLRKADAVRTAALPPAYVGPKKPRTLILTWGSTCAAMDEAWRSAPTPGTGWMHFSQVFPLHVDAISMIKSAKHVIVVEGNATGQFARLVTLETGVIPTIEHHKYDGFAFPVEELALFLGTLREKR